MVGETSERLRTVCSISPGAGRPASMYRVPAWARARLTLWLPPKVWFQGSQSTSTRRCAVTNGQVCSAIIWLAHIIRCVLMTPFGMPVEPEVNSTLATVSGPTAANARSTALVGVAAEQLRQQRGAHALRRIGADDHLAVAEIERRQRLGEGLAARRVDDARADRGEDVLQLVVVLAHQRVGDRDRHRRHAGDIGAEGEEPRGRCRCPTGSSAGARGRSRGR